MSISALLGKQIDVESSGKIEFQGILIAISNEIIVLFDSEKYIYLPFLHVHRLNESSVLIKDISNPSTSPFLKEEDSLSLQGLLENAKGRFIEIYVNGNVSLHGYISSVHQDYFSFYSPVFKTILILSDHLKWLIPYDVKTVPYTVAKEKIPSLPSNLSLHSLFEEQIKRWENNLVVFDMGGRYTKIGLVKQVNKGIVELVVANGKTVYIKLSHIQTAYVRE